MGSGTGPVPDGFRSMYYAYNLDRIRDTVATATFVKTSEASFAPKMETSWDFLHSKKKKKKKPG